MIKNKKLLITSLFVIGIISIIVVNWQKGTQSKLEELHPIEYSKNQEASKEFLKAMEYKAYISQLHTYFNYDNFVMVPFLEKMNFHFNKGKNLLPQNSVEDIVWFVALYKDIYALVVPEKDDYSLAYEKLPFDEFAKKHDEIFEMIKRYPFGEINFDIKQINEYKFQTMAILVEFYIARYTNRYENMKEKTASVQFMTDIEVTENLNNTLDYYKIVKEKYLNSSSFYDDMELHYFTDIVNISLKLLGNKLYLDQQLKNIENICNSKEASVVKENTQILLDTLKLNTHQSKVIFQNIFDGKIRKDEMQIFVVLNHKKCINLQPNMYKVLLEIYRINKVSNYEELKKLK